MPTVAERLAHVTLKVKRAKEHIEDLNREIRRFLDTNPYTVGAKNDPKTGKLIYYVSGVQQAPSCLPLIAGDAIQNLMSALDHLAYQLVCSDTADAPPNPGWIYFPIADDATKYDSKKRGKIEGALQATFDAIDALKPYKGGNDVLWQLYRLNNIEKHRMLITVGSSFQSLDIGAHMSALMNSSRLGEKFPVMSFFVRPADGLFPLKVGDELFIDSANAKVNPDMQFRFNVALNEPGIIEGKPILETVHEFVGLVEGIVIALTPRLK